MTKIKFILLIQEAITEAMRNKSFNLAVFKGMSDLEQMNQYVKETGLERLGSGSSREVYLLSSRKVLKLLNPEFPWGKQQNAKESEIGENPEFQPMVAKVYETGPDHNWLISELVKPVTKEEVPGIVGFDFDMIIGFLSAYTRKSSLDFAFGFVKTGFGDQPDMLKKFIPYARAMARFVKKGKMYMGDIMRIEHWGKTADGRLVLLDYGL